MKPDTQILIVDDHPMTVQAYEIFLKGNEKENIFKIGRAYNCDQVLSEIKSKQKKFYDLVLLDINLPSSKDNKIVSGEDLGQHMKRKFPSVKLIVHTSLNDYQRISDIYKTLKPEGFLIKTDIEPNILLEAVNSVLNGHTYYSERMNLSLRSCKTDKLYIDSLDRKILYYRSIGEKMKNLPQYIPLSMPSIERRKKRMKILLGIPDQDDRELLAVARKKGFL
ncbi:MAG: response regulator [Saonia sp.]